ncbi:MAG: bifunctional folylpolyglutamate synthase/dihydrofolate synthase [Clostridia bacterium]|nr:bifunctional folylpolyglutamate synthase/dihydrofolate synthase [Clostridia bacterium]
MSMNYNEAIEYIHSVNWMFCNPGLDRVRALCRALGDPQDSLKFIHVAGTNGKGSFCSMLDSILRAQGYRVGLFTSPYILEFGERMRVDGENISEKELCELVETVRPIADAMEDKPTEFELITALAFLYFANHNCDYVVLECGLGGRLDATNIIKTPILSVITGIALDHTAILGDTEEKIAAEKAGIIKNAVPVLWCGTHKGAEQVIRSRALEMNAPVLTVDRSLLAIKEMSLNGTDFDFGNHKDIHIPLLGSYQPLNASNVLTAVDALRAQSVEIGEDAVRSGLASTVWHARFEVIHKNPLVIADGGHNPEGIDGAVESIKRYFPNGRVGIVTGVMADKDYRYMAGRMAEVGKQVFCLTPDNPRALSASEYAQVFEGLGIPAVACDTVENAVTRALAWGKESGTPIVCLGSLYMYGEVVKAIGTRDL